MTPPARLLTVLALVSAAASVHSATYYVDASAGNDSWSGRLASPAGISANDGPWQTLARVGAGVLMPGDSVLLRCGQTWRESLPITGSGTASSPIVIASYPAPCQQKPAIDGSVAVPAHNWKPFSGAIYRATLPINLLSNSRPDATLSGWRQYSPRADALMSASSACAPAVTSCIAYTSGSGATNSLVISNNFPLSTGLPHRAVFSLKAPAGVRIWVVVRRASPPYEPVGLSTVLTGNNAWQDYSLGFSALKSLDNARLDFEVPPGGITVGVADVRVEILANTATQLLFDGRPLDAAHHPNRGHDPQHPQSPYLSVAEDSDQVLNQGRPVSSYVTLGPDLHLPAGASLTPGIGVRLRTTSWLIDERTIASVSGSRVHLDAPTSFPLKRAWGYAFFGALWMLDEPGEWHFDAPTRTVYAWAPDSAPPGARMAIGHRDYGIDLSGRAYVIVDGIAVRHVGSAVMMDDSTGVAFTNGEIAYVQRDAISAVGSRKGLIANNLIRGAGRNAIAAADTVGGAAIELTVSNNDISESGVLLSAGKVVSSPTPALAAIVAGKQALVSGNRVEASAYIGISAQGQGRIIGNYVGSSCLVLDDCAAIYLRGADDNSIVEDNLVAEVVGAPDGKPPGYPSQAQGLYLDDQASGISLRRNTVVGADNGVQLHNASSNRVEYNTLFGNRNHQIWLQESTAARRQSGDVFDNFVLGNFMFPTGASASIRHESRFAAPDNFATYELNRYSSLLSSQIADESWASGARSYTFGQWQQAVRTNGLPRNLDLGGSEVSALGYAPYLVTAPSVISNGRFVSDTAGWHGWNLASPYAQIARTACTPGHCLNFTAGATASLLSSPYFSVLENQWYRLSFDLATGSDNQPVSIILRRGGGGSNGYEWLMAKPERIFGSRTWRRYAFALLAKRSVKAFDPVTLDNGARLDFENILPGQTITLANVEMVPLSPIEASLKTHILTNPSRGSLAIECPDLQSEPAACSRYQRFRDGASLSWPYVLAPLGSEVVYSRDLSLTDADGDGIADSQDACPGTAAAAVVDASGCAMGQIRP